MGETGAAKSGMEFRGDGAPSHGGLTFHDQRFEAGFSQIKCGDQPVVSGADDDDVASFGHRLAAPLGLLQDLQRGQAARSTHDAASGMSGRAAHPQVLDRRLVLRPARHRTQEEQLLQRQLALEDIAFGQSPLAFQIKRRYDLPPDDDVLQIRRIFRDGVDDVVAEGFALLVPMCPLSACRVRTARSTTSHACPAAPPRDR